MKMTKRDYDEARECLLSDIDFSGTHSLYPKVLSAVAKKIASLREEIAEHKERERQEAMLRLSAEEIRLRRLQDIAKLLGEQESDTKARIEILWSRKHRREREEVRERRCKKWCDWKRELSTPSGTMRTYIGESI